MLILNNINRSVGLDDISNNNSNSDNISNNIIRGYLINRPY